jgi:cytochrome c oxidase assembly protein subunit 15
VITAVLTFPLVSVGGLVTSLRVGMIDETPVRTPWHFIKLLAEEGWASHPVGYWVEHGHRQLGWLVGLCAIVLAWWTYFGDPRKEVRWLGVLGLAGVMFQGGLGIARVGLDRLGLGLEFAMIHGVAGQLVFALLVALALMLSRSWVGGLAVESPAALRFRKVCRLTLMLMLVQLPLGVWYRQQGGTPVLLAHGFFGVAILTHVVMIFVRTFARRQAPSPLFRRPAAVLLVLVLLQALLGLAAWWWGGSTGEMDLRAELGPADRMLHAELATAHVAGGALLLALTTLVTLRAARHLTPTPAIGA